LVMLFSKKAGQKTCDWLPMPSPVTFDLEIAPGRYNDSLASVMGPKFPLGVGEFY
jgi:hypothetical protein